MATATDDYNEVIFSDGEEADFADVNELQRRFRSLIAEAFLAARIPNGLQDPTASFPTLDPEMSDWPVEGGDITFWNDAAFAPYPGNGMIAVSANANEVRVWPGVFVQGVNDVITPGDYTAPACLVFVNKAAVALATAVGDATNPRIDIVEMKLETVSDTSTSRDFEDAVTRVKSSAGTNKARRTKATFQIKQGTPAASPAYPSCTAGFVPLGAVYVPATHNAVHTVANMRDMRWPLGGVRVYDVDYNALNIAGGGTPWTLNHTKMAAESGSPSGFVYAQCPGGSVGRLLAVGAFGHFPSDGDVLLRKITHNGSDPTAKATLVDCQTTIHDPLAGGGAAFAWAHAINFMDDVAAGHGSRVASSRIGAPIWTDGTFSGPIGKVAVEDDTSATRDRLALEILGDNPDTGTYISFVRFVVAHGMG